MVATGFTYSAAEEGIAELRTREEYESCDTSNPIRMYTGGLDKIELGHQGPRYFVSTSHEVCNKGLKLRVHVEPQQQKAEPAGNEVLTEVVHVAAGPKPSSSLKVGPVSSGLLIGLGLICLIGFV